MAHHDALTNLPNRALLLDRLESAIRQARRHHEGLAVLMLDLDHFKRINDSLGHQVGDKLLLQISQRLQNSVREVDTVARLGGDAFGHVLTGTNSTVEIQALTAEPMKTISAPRTTEGKEQLNTKSKK